MNNSNYNYLIYSNYENLYIFSFKKQNNLNEKKDK